MHSRPFTPYNFSQLLKVPVLLVWKAGRVRLPPVVQIPGGFDGYWHSVGAGVNAAACGCWRSEQRFSWQVGCWLHGLFFMVKMVTALKLLGSFAFQSKVITEEGWRLRGDACTQQHFSCAVVIWEERFGFFPGPWACTAPLKSDGYGAREFTAPFVRPLHPKSDATSCSGGVCVGGGRSRDALCVAQAMTVHSALF